MFSEVSYDFSEFNTEEAQRKSHSDETQNDISTDEKERKMSTTNKKDDSSSQLTCYEEDDDSNSSKIEKITANSDWNKRQNHSEIEKRRRDKMNTYIMELGSIIPVGTARKLDKLTVLRMAVQHMKMLRGSLNSYTEGHYKPAFLSDDELKTLILQAADGFLFVVGCDRGRILYVSESVSEVLQYSHSELLGTSWFDILHHKDLNKVKDQLSSLDINRRERLVDAKTLLPVKNDVPQGLSRLCPGSRRSFFCRMRCKSSAVMKEEADTTTGVPKKKAKLQTSDKKYNVIHFTGYLKSWAPSRDPVEEETEGESGSCNLSCLVAVGRVHQPLLASVPQDPLRLSRVLPNKPIVYVSKHNNDGKFVFIDLKSTLLIGWLPQELLGSSMYEFFHQDDISSLSDIHRTVLQAKESIQTPVYRFRNKDGTFLHMKSKWKAFTNPWTKEIQYIISENCLVTPDSREVESTMVSDNVSSQSFNIGGAFVPQRDFLSSPTPSQCSVTSSMLVNNSFQASKIGQNIAKEAFESQDSGSPTHVVGYSPKQRNMDSHSDVSTIVKPQDGSCSDMSVDSDAIQKQQAFNHNKNLVAGQPDRSYRNPSHERVGSDNNDMANVVTGREFENEVTSDSDEAAMAVIMSLLEADAGLGGPVDFSHLPWPLP